MSLLSLETSTGIPGWKLVNSATWSDCVPDDSTGTIHETEVGVGFNRTSEERFKHLSGYPFEPHDALVEGLRMH